MFRDSLQNECNLGINFWEKQGPVAEGLAFTLPGPNKTGALFWEAELDHYGQSVDPRGKFSGWLKQFPERDGNRVFQDASPQDLCASRKNRDLSLGPAG